MYSGRECRVSWVAAFYEAVPDLCLFASADSKETRSGRRRFAFCPVTASQIAVFPTTRVVRIRLF